MCQRSPTKGEKRQLNYCIFIRVRNNEQIKFNECKPVYKICEIFFTCCQLKCKPCALYSLSLKSLKNSQPIIGDKIRLEIVRNILSLVLSHLQSKLQLYQIINLLFMNLVLISDIETCTMFLSSSQKAFSDWLSILL